ncbi:hypothetical protein [Bosea sp. 2RAB26]|uniref:hypothetical protein n=1 Tax=Bosea sp. 2RAB26 TaxID=3237476 RepID=UPI003F9038D0
MPRPRTPKAVAAVTGRDKINPARFYGRNEPEIAEKLGDPPEWLLDTATTKPREAWEQLRSSIPWLNQSHRGITAIAATVMGRMISGQEVGTQSMNLLRQCLGQMGATPADASRVGLPDAPGEPDPADEFFD